MLLGVFSYPDRSCTKTNSPYVERVYDHTNTPTLHGDRTARRAPPPTPPPSTRPRGRPAPRPPPPPRRARVRLALLGTTTLASVVATVNVGVSLASELTQSGASEYLTLLWTDADIVLAHSEAFLLSLSEVLPLSGITLLLAVLFVLLWTLPRVSAAARVAFTPARSLAVS